MTGSAARRLRRLPPVRRARGFRLYTLGGERFVDLWQASGRAILGHGGPAVAHVKRVLDRGTLAPAPSTAERQLVQALRRLLTGYPPFNVAVYGTMEAAVAAAAAALGLPPDRCVPREPLAPSATASPLALWRPFLPPADPETAAQLLLPVLPDGGLFTAQVLLYPADAGMLLASDIVAEPALAALTAAAHALVSPKERPVIALHGFSGVGPYLVPDDSRDYDRVFDRFLSEGVLISPDPAVPSIVPGELSDGERARVERAARS